MKIVQFIGEHAGFFFVCSVIGCGASFVREFRIGLSTSKRRMLLLTEWCLIPPGFAALFITLQQHSVRYFALHPKGTIAAYLTIAAFSIFLIIEKKRKRHALLSWIGGLFGLPGAVISLVLLGLFFQSPKKFESIRETYGKVAATEGKIAPDFAFTLLSNRERRQLADYRGKVVLLNIWATWCIPCLKEMPDLDKLQRKFGDAGFVVIHLSDEALETIDRHLSKHPMVTTHGRVEKKDVPEFYQFGGARPTTFVVDANGKIVEAIVGTKDIGYFDSIIRKVKP